MSGKRLSGPEAWELADLVGASYVAIAEIAGDAAGAHGVNLSELIGLAILAQHPEGLTQTQWGRLQGVSRQRAHTVTQGLVRRRLVVSRRRGRSSQVRLSAAGARLTDEMRESVGARLSSAMADVDASTLRELIRILPALLESLNRARATRADDDAVRAGK